MTMTYGGGKQNKVVCDLRSFVDDYASISMTPGIQRALDVARVDEIVRFQKQRPSLLFVGDVSIFARDKGVPERLWVVDGQHRLEACRQLVSVDPAYVVSLTIVDLDDELTLPGLFTLVNKSVPVPEYIIETTLDSRCRALLDKVCRSLSATFPAYCSSAKAPRRPNMNFESLVGELVASPLKDRLVALGPDGILRYLSKVNDALGAVADETSKTRADAKCPSMPLYLSLDVDRRCLTDARVLDAWHAGEPLEQTLGTSVIGKRKVQIPKAVRMAVWRRYIGESFGHGACECCGAVITQSNFHCGHVVAAAHGGAPVIDNLRPLCSLCNTSMSSRNLDEFKRTYFAKK